MVPLSEENVNAAKREYERLKALRADVTNIEDNSISDDLGNYYIDLVNIFGEYLAEDLSKFHISISHLTNETYPKTDLLIKSNQLLLHLEELLDIEPNIYAVERAIKLINDELLRARCEDLLDAEGNFDRVIRESTTILEDRIKEFCDERVTDIGIALVDKVFNPNNGIRVLAEDSSENEGLYQLLRGIMLGFRNTSHHRIVEDLTKENAMKTLMFIDILLEFVTNSKTKDEFN